MIERMRLVVLLLGRNADEAEELFLCQPPRMRCSAP